MEERNPLPGNAPQLGDVFLLRRVVGGQSRQMIEQRIKLSVRFVEIARKVGVALQQETTDGAFGPLHLQLSQGYLVLDFDRVRDPGSIVLRTVDKENRRRADRHQNHEAGRQQADLPNRP